MMDVAALKEAQTRLQAVYDPQRFRAAAQEWADTLSAHLEQVIARQPRVLNWADPAANIAEAERWLDRPAAEFGDIVQQMLDRGHNLHHPRYIGHQVPAPVPIAGLFDAVGAVTNQVMAIYEMGPWATAVERALVNRLGEQVGWPRDSFAGLVTHGGSLGNLTGLLTARNVMLGGSWEEGVTTANVQPVIVVHGDAHYSVARAAGVIGLGTKHVLRAALDGRQRLDPQKLDDQLAELRAQGRRVVAVSACACATPIGAFDPLREVAAVCRKQGVWMHVDAAHGGAALFSRRYRHLLDGLDQTDSVVWDAHKMMFMPALCAFVLYRDKRHRFETFRQEAPYLFDPSAPGMAEYDSGMLTLECTKRAAAYGLWGTWSLFGQQLFEDLVDVTFGLGRLFFEKLSATEDFVALHEPECNIVAFRHVPAALRSASPEVVGAFQRELRRRLIESGRFYIVQTNFGGCGALRVTIINPLTTADDLDALLAALREIGQELLRSGWTGPR
jgi:L-2,4-diaminobutyrate decarboxylase